MIRRTIKGLFLWQGSCARTFPGMGQHDMMFVPIQKPFRHHPPGFCIGQRSSSAHSSDQYRCHIVRTSPLNVFLSFAQNVTEGVSRWRVDLGRCVNFLVAARGKQQLCAYVNTNSMCHGLRCQVAWRQVPSYSGAWHALKSKLAKVEECCSGWSKTN